MTSALKGRDGIIIHTPFQAPKAPESLARNLGWRAVQLPLEPPKTADGDGYLAHIGHWIDALASAK